MWFNFYGGLKHRNRELHYILFNASTSILWCGLVAAWRQVL
ncbi:hypothetical protein O9929_15455 [Vibrio lentus]|nr:hypothetical protein [Vibrio lentus]